MLPWSFSNTVAAHTHTYRTAGIFECRGSCGRGRGACLGTRHGGDFLTAFVGWRSPLGPPPQLPALLAVISAQLPRGIK